MHSTLHIWFFAEFCIFLVSRQSNAHDLFITFGQFAGFFVISLHISKNIDMFACCSLLFLLLPSFPSFSPPLLSSLSNAKLSSSAQTLRQRSKIFLHVLYLGRKMWAAKQISRHSQSNLDKASSGTKYLRRFWHKQENNYRYSGRRWDEINIFIQCLLFLCSQKYSSRQRKI